MANDNSHKFKHNQIIFCILPWIVEFSRHIVFGEDRLRERGSLSATYYVLKRVIFFLTNGNCRKFNENQISFCTFSWVVESSRSVDFGEDQLRERGSLPATFYVVTREMFPWRTITQNQIFFWIHPLIVEDWRSIDFGEDRLRERGSLPETFHDLTSVKYLILINKVPW